MFYSSRKKTYFFTAKVCPSQYSTKYTKTVDQSTNKVTRYNFKQRVFSLLRVYFSLIDTTCQNQVLWLYKCESLLEADDFPFSFSSTFRTILELQRLVLQVLLAYGL